MTWYREIQRKVETGQCAEEARGYHPQRAKLRRFSPKFFLLPVAAVQAISHTAPTPKIRVVSLVRVSTVEQAAEGRGGLDRQRAVVARTIAAKNLDCIQAYELVGVSGTVTGRDPEIRETLARVLSGEVQGLVCADLDRLFRPDQPESFGILQVFKDSGALIYAGGDIYDLTQGSGLLFSSIRSAIAGYELTLMRERQQGAKEAKRRAGKCPTNRLTLGLGICYDRKTETWGFTPEIAKVKELFFAFDSGVHNYGELGRRFGLNPATVRVILQNPIYTGWRVISQKRGGKRVSKSGKTYRVKVARSDEEVIKNKVLEGVVPDELFERVQKEMQKTKYNFIERLRSNDTVNLNAGVAFCACCGEPLQITSGKRRTEAGRTPGTHICKSNHYLYKKRLGGCRQPHTRADWFDAATTELTATILGDPERLAAILEQSSKRQRESLIPFPGSLSSAELEAKLQKRDARLLEAYEEGAISLAELKLKRTAIRNEREALAKLDTPKSAPSHDQILETARRVVKAAVRFRGLTDKRQQKAIIHSLFEAIYIRDRAIVSFTLCEGIIGDESTDKTVGLVTLAEPLWIGPKPAPEGFRRCIECDALKPERDFYRILNQCDPCRNAKANERRRRRKAKDAKASTL